MYGGNYEGTQTSHDGDQAGDDGGDQGRHFSFFRGIIFDDLFWIFHENTRLYSFTKFPITLF